MKTPNIEAIAAKISAVASQRATLTNLIADRQRARAQIESAIALAAGALTAATAALDMALTLEAVGEAEPGAVAAARAAILAADKALSAACKHEGEARELAAAEGGLAARLAPLDAEIAALHQQAADARLVVTVAELQSRIDAYTSTASTAMQNLAAVLALDQHLNSIGKPQEIGVGFARQTVIGMFTGRTMPGIDDLMNNARMAVLAEFGTAAR